MKTLCLHTAQFPYGFGEQFIETEIKYLVQAFDRVVIMPAQAKGEKRYTPTNVEIIAPFSSNYTTSKGVLSMGWWIKNCIVDALKGPEKNTKISALLRAAYQSNVLLKILKNNYLLNSTLHYTYWFNEQSTLLSIIKAKGEIKGFISRAHGFDLYEERNSGGSIPFRSFQLQHVTKLFLISKHGLNYISSKYPQHRHKYQLSLLGVENPALFSYHPPKDESYHVVSCSRMVEIKRIHLIIKALSNIRTKKILWTHIGDGRLFEQIKHQAKTSLPSNIKYNFLGHIDNSRIFSFYQQANIDVFINVSSSEGLPVTIMEAISFGIPIIATDVGGTSEIVTNRTGILLNPDPKIEDITNAIITSFNSKTRSREFREDIHKYWGQHFDAKTNYQKFTHELAQISN